MGLAEPSLDVSGKQVGLAAGAGPGSAVDVTSTFPAGPGAHASVAKDKVRLLVDVKDPRSN